MRDSRGSFSTGLGGVAASQSKYLSVLCKHAHTDPHACALPKLTPLEISFIPPTEAPEVILRRLCIILALKQAYIKAIGQPIGFDLSRLEFNLPGESARGDGYPLTGWEFRLWQSQIAVLREDGEVETHQYQCASAFFRGSEDSKFIWQKDRKELETWVQFLNIDQLLTVLPKLTD